MTGDNLGVKHTERAAKVPLVRKMLVLCSLGRIILIASWVYSRKVGPCRWKLWRIYAADIFMEQYVVRTIEAPTTRKCCRGLLANRITKSS